LEYILREEVENGKESEKECGVDEHTKIKEWKK